MLVMFEPLPVKFDELILTALKLVMPFTVLERAIVAIDEEPFVTVILFPDWISLTIPTEPVPPRIILLPFRLIELFSNVEFCIEELPELLINK